MPEGSAEVNQFSSRFHAYLAGTTAKEQLGMDLFNGKAVCAACHPAPLFTDFTYDNLGVPKNPDNPFYTMDQVFLDDGSPINPLGEAWVDPGLAGFLDTLDEGYFTALGFVKADAGAENYGKQKVPTLRNVALAPGKGVTKAYMHNGVFKSLAEEVHFYNIRDVQPVCPDGYTGTIGVTCWPAPEVAANVNRDELGNLGLTAAEEDALVAFMQMLSDTQKVAPPQTQVSR